MKVKIKLEDIWEKLGFKVSLFLQSGMAYKADYTKFGRFRAVKNDDLDTTIMDFPSEIEVEGEPIKEKEEVPVRLMAPAIHKTMNGRTCYVTSQIYCDEQSAKNDVYYGSMFIKWPAVPNKWGFYEI